MFKGKRFAPAMIVAMIALAVALSGTAVAGTAKLITGSQIANGTIKLADIHPSVKSAFKGARGATGAQGAQDAQGPAGPQGSTGAKGDKGLKGDTGLIGYEVRSWRYSSDNNTDSGPGYVGVGAGAIATVACSSGKVALGGGYWFKSQGDNGFNAPELSDGSGVTASFPGRINWGANTVKPNDNSGWIVQVNKKVTLADLTVYVICANAN
jgi:hypothetical protein